MQIEISADSTTEGGERLSAHVKNTVEGALGRFSDRISRVEVHLGDENTHKGGHDDKRCMMEVRISGRPPVAITHHAATLEQAVEGAAGKTQRLVESTIGRESTLEALRDRR